jgi:hypothetical protein
LGVLFGVPGRFEHQPPFGLEKGEVAHIPDFSLMKAFMHSAKASRRTLRNSRYPCRTPDVVALDFRQAELAALVYVAQGADEDVL